MRSVLPKNAHLIPEGAKRVFKGVIFDVYQWQQKMFDGTEAPFEMLRRPDTVKALAIKDGKIVMLDEEQPHYGRGYELPGGRNDVETEDELAAAKREMREETGMTFKTWKLLDVYQPLSKIEAFVYLFLATGIQSEGDKQLDVAGEKNNLRLVSYEECLEFSRTEAGKYLPKDILEKAGSIDGLFALPEYQ